MTIQIDKDTIEKMVAANIAMNTVLTNILSSLNEERWVSPAQAEAETGISAQTVRWMARNGKIESRRIGPGKRLMEVKLSDLLS